MIARTVQALAATIVLVGMGGALIGCALIERVNPFAVAETPVQQADALYGVYVIALEQAAEIAAYPETSPDVVRHLAEAAALVKPLMDGMQLALAEYERIRAAIDAGQRPAAALVPALAQLDDARALAAQALAAFEAMLRDVDVGVRT